MKIKKSESTNSRKSSFASKKGMKFSIILEPLLLIIIYWQFCVLLAKIEMFY